MFNQRRTTGFDNQNSRPYNNNKDRGSGRGARGKHNPWQPRVTVAANRGGGASGINRDNGSDWRPNRSNQENSPHYQRGQENMSSEGFDHRNRKFHNQSGRKYHMGFKYVENLLDNEDLEFVLVTLNNDNKGFRELIAGDLSNDMITLLVKLLAKICSSSFDTLKVRLLQMALQSSFAENLVTFISKIAPQGMTDKNRSKYFWNDTDEFWNNVICICRNVQNLIPLTLCDTVLKILNTMKIYIPVIEDIHSIHISDEIKDNVKHLHNVVEKTVEEKEKKLARNEVIIESAELEPPDNFRDISIYPTVNEITVRDFPFVRPNVIDGPYQNVDHYLDVQFRLLREDFVAPLRKGICKYLENTKERLEDIKVYYPIHFLNVEVSNEYNSYRIQFDFSNKKKSFQYENSRRFLFGSLLCFTIDNFQTIIFGKVVKREIKDLEQGQLIVGFDEDVVIPKNLFNAGYLMVESKVYFEPYYQVLSALKTIQNQNFPMERYIVRVETDNRPPEYLLTIDPVFFQIEDQRFWPLNWNDEKFYGLNDAQNTAFKAALTKEFCIIQGPPGTGKTFLGLKIAHTLLNNAAAWYKKTPMLVICFTNHALDQFLEGLLDVTKKIIRVGGQSKNEKLKDYNIRNNRGTKDPTVLQRKRLVKSHLQTLSTIDEYVKHAQSYESVLDFSVFSRIIAEYDNSWFSYASKNDILKWLFESRDESTQMDRNRNAIKQMDNNVNPNNDDTTPELEEANYEFMENEDEILDDVFEDTTGSVKLLVSLEQLTGRINILNRELEYLKTDSSLSPLQQMFRGKEILVELDVLERDYRYLQSRSSEAARGGFWGKPEFIDLQNPSLMPPKSRWHLYFYWLRLYKNKLLEKKEVVTLEFRKDYKIYNELCTVEDTQVMKDVFVVGMTTTAAARLKSSLLTLKSPIVIVEEAAEVLEAHIVSSLTSSCKHLILIGDHQQLKPSTANFTIETKYLLGISLFERMVKNKIQCHTLNIQHRMRPEIANLIRPTIYPVLDDHESVLNMPPIDGVENFLYFIDHQEPEQLCNDSSKKNTHEAAFLIRFAKHLILNGHEPEKITIIAAYLGQMFEMLRQRTYFSLPQDVKITVLDNYQGEENDIILLSLVRSNSENKIGFLKIENRVCVALSRARCGFYIMGNMTRLCKESNIWVKIRESLENQNAIGTHLTLRCQIHRYKLTRVQTAEDFMNIPEGGCELMCESSLNCGHICKSLCHIMDRDHALYKCLEKCDKVLCNNEQHICQKICYEDCGPCRYPVEHALECGHNVIIDCCIDPATYDCPIQVKSVLPCGHEVDKPCFRDPETFDCTEPCAFRVEPCGHACIRMCHIRNDPDHLQYKCRKPCTKPKQGCSLPDDNKHLCTKFCCEECENCDVVVKKSRTVCSHVYKISCRLNVDDLECGKPCKKILPCEHPCKNKCHEPCGNCNVKVLKVLADCNHKVNIKCSEEPTRKLCYGKCPRLLPCGHICDRRCCDECTTSCKFKVDCSVPSPCGHVVKRITCALRNSVESKVLLKNCSEKCNTTLKCGHVCPGTCGQCYQGRIHQRCKEKCGNILICNHECPIPCSQTCRPCQLQCEYKCSHNKCAKQCGDPCTLCKERCKRRCVHQKCSKFCGDICDVLPCYEPCSRQLRCGHPCVGFCGDPCPTLCRICNFEELTDIFLGHEDEDNARYVMLMDCKHIFESGDMEKWLHSDGEIMAKCCPKCKTAITITQRYSEYIKRSMIDIKDVKKRTNGSFEENEKRRNLLLNEVENIQIKVADLNKVSALPKIINKLKERLHISTRKRNQERRQTVNKIDLDVIHSKLQVVDFIIDVFEKQDYKILPSDDSAVQISFIIDVLMRDDYITQQEIEDTMLEIERLSRIIQYETIKKTSNFTALNALNNDGLKTRKGNIEKLLNMPKRYDKEIDGILQKELTELNKFVASSVSITEAEKKQIVAALGLQKGHWFKCPNGHYYIITECGGANQISKCNECGVEIGGQNHRLLPGQQHAREMDNSHYPAWSEAANMENYRF